MTERVAACTCQDLRIGCAGEPRRVSLCHCFSCQRRTSSLFSIAAFYEREAVTPLHGTAATFTRDSASGFPVTFHFCPRCGSSVCWEPARLPLLIGVAVGAFADPHFPKPEQAVWASQRHGWLGFPADVVTFSENPPAARR